ncbi:MAG TPA: MarR family transcriptional regulator [Chloroflexota bacterium]|nr:MarR family transcriptional regulator [Chloroflexota bacterium]
MDDLRARLTSRVLDLQTDLYRSLRPSREWFEVDLTMSQLKVMLLLSADGSASMSRLAGALGVSLATATGIVDRLVEHGLVRRDQDPHDRRLVLCRPTPRGLALTERLQQAGASSLAPLLRHLSVADLRVVAAGLEILCGAAHQQPSDWEAPGARLHAPGSAALTTPVMHRVGK